MPGNLKKYALTALCSGIIGFCGCNLDLNTYRETIPKSQEMASLREELKRKNNEVTSLARESELKGKIESENLKIERLKSNLRKHDQIEPERTDVYENERAENLEPNANISYDRLVDLARQNRGILEVSINATNINETYFKSNFYQPNGDFKSANLGFKSVKSMEGILAKDFLVRLTTSNIETEQDVIVQDSGELSCYAYSFETEMLGNVGGNVFALKVTPDGVTKIKEDRGYAWATKMQGKLGDKMDVYFTTTKTSEFGEKCPVEATLTFKVAENN